MPRPAKKISRRPVDEPSGPARRKTMKPRTDDRWELKRYNARRPRMSHAPSCSPACLPFNVVHALSSFTAGGGTWPRERRRYDHDGLIKALIIRLPVYRRAKGGDAILLWLTLLFLFSRIRRDDGRRCSTVSTLLLPRTTRRL